MCTHTHTHTHTQVAAWVAGPAALAVGTGLLSPPPSILGAKVRAVSSAASSMGPPINSPTNSPTNSPASGPPSPEAASKWGAASTHSRGKGLAQRTVAMAQSTVAVEVEGMASWLVCHRGRDKRNDVLVVNLAHGQPVRVSSETPEGEGFMAVDGREDTRWMSHAMDDSQSIEVDLGAVYRVCAVNVHWGVATALSFEVQVAAPQRWEPEYVRREPEYVRSTNSSMTSGLPELDVALFDLALRRKSKVFFFYLALFY